MIIYKDNPEDKIYHKAFIIFKLLNGLQDVHIILEPNYNSSGTLDFSFRSKASLSCRIQPNEDGTYSIRFYQVHNMSQSTILSEIHDIHEDKLYSSFLNTVKFLDEEYTNHNLLSWSEYKNGSPECTDNIFKMMIN